MVISPVIMCGNNIQNAFALIYAFSIITLLSVAVASFIPKKLPYAIKITAYAVISSFIYIPIRVLSSEIYPDSIENIGIYFPLLAVNSLIVYQTEVRFFKLSRLNMLTNLVFYIFGFDVVILITAFIREMFGSGTINSNVVDIDFIVSGISQPFGGFILLGLMCGLYRKIRAISANEKNNTEVK